MAFCLAQLRRQAITRATGEFAKSAADLTADVLDPWFTQAYVDLQRRLRLYTATDTQNIVADQSSYDRPSDMLDGMVLNKHAVRVLDANGHVSYPAERTWGAMVERYAPFTNEDAVHGPMDWAWDANDQEKLILWWPPESSITNGLAIDYVVHPGDLSRNYDDDTATASVTNGSTTVTFAASISGLVQTGDVFGVKADADSLPTTWHRIESVDSTTQITLTSAYAGATDASALFTLSQVSPLEWARPGLVADAPVEYALMRIAQMEQGQTVADLYEARWERVVERIERWARTRPGLQMRGPDVTRIHPAFNPRRLTR